jgi:hypothetical protein
MNRNTKKVLIELTLFLTLFFSIYFGIWVSLGSVDVSRELRNFVFSDTQDGVVESVGYVDDSSGNGRKSTRKISTGYSNKTHTATKTTTYTFQSVTVNSLLHTSLFSEQPTRHFGSSNSLQVQSSSVEPRVYTVSNSSKASRSVPSINNGTEQWRTIQNKRANHNNESFKTNGGWYGFASNPVSFKNSRFFATADIHRIDADGLVQDMLVNDEPIMQKFPIAGPGEELPVGDYLLSMFVFSCIFIGVKRYRRDMKISIT